MPRAWTVIERLETNEGPLELRQRDIKDFLITIDGRVLMNSLANRSEVVLGELACASLKDRKTPQVVLGGLGMGYTLRATLDTLPNDAKITVVELNPVVERWCQGPLSHLTDNALQDPRVSVVIDDIARYLKNLQPKSVDAIVLDLYEGPNQATHAEKDPFFGRPALKTFTAALRPGGILAIWSEQSDRPFEQRLQKLGLKVRCLRPGRGGLRHAVYLAEKLS